MTFIDTLRFASHAARSYPQRTVLMVLAMSIGVAAVVILTALGEGVRNYVVGQFASMGSNLIIIMPGRTETGGLSINFRNTQRDLSIEDAAALTRLPLARQVAPIALGSSEVAANGRLRDVAVLGTTSSFTEIRYMSLSQGRFLPDEDWRNAKAVAVIGATIQSELFGSSNPVGQMIRLGDHRLRVAGVMASSGQGMLDLNTDELVIVPVATALSLFNTTTLFRIMVEIRDRDAIEEGKSALENILRARHDGELDVTLITQDAMLGTFDNILGAITVALGGVAAISLVVAGILIMNVMLVSVTQRTAEVGLLKALGASGRDIVRMFLTEAALLSLLGAVIGFGLGQGGAWLLRLSWPVLQQAWPPVWAVVAALGIALGSGFLFGVMPARRAAALDPIFALARH
ncbi:MAG: ABC transporter permease [Azoarcus sp.]|jgi:putative ABC transport system permease protein|nr:ABC transporter permease [Azoarcus sp.]